MLTLFAAVLVADLFARNRATLEQRKGTAFDFEWRSTAAQPLRGHAMIKGRRMRIDTDAFTLWSDGDEVEVVDRGARTAWHNTLRHSGALLLRKYAHDVADAYASPTRFDATLVYKPQPAGSGSVHGRACDRVVVEYPGGGWQWCFDRDDHLLRRQEHIIGKTTETIDYWNVRATAETPRRPAASFARKTYSAGEPQPGQQPKPWSARTLDGRTLTPASLAGKVAVIDFWATWCVPCRPAMAALQRLHERDGDLAIVGLRWQDSGDARAFATANHLMYLLGDAGDAAKSFAVDAFGIPLVYVLDTHGRVVDYNVGYDGAATDRWLDETIARARDVAHSKRSVDGGSGQPPPFHAVEPACSHP